MLRFLSFVFVAAMAGCGPVVTWAPTNPPPHALSPRPGHLVAVFTTSRPAGAYAELGLLQARERHWGSELSEVIEELKEEAGELGCDAIILSGRADVAPGSDDSGPRDGVYGTCVVYVSDAHAGAGSGGYEVAAGR